MKLPFRLIVIAIIWLSGAWVVAADMLVEVPGHDPARASFATYFFHYNYEVPLNATCGGPLVYLPSNHSTVESSMIAVGLATLNGSIVITSDIPTIRLFWTWVSQLPDAGVAAVIFVEGTDSSIGVLDVGRGPAQLPLPIPVYGMALAEWQTLSQLMKNYSGEIFNIQISDSGRVTPWRIFLSKSSMYVLSIMLASVAGGVGLVLGFKAFMYARVLSIRALPTWCLLFDTILCVLVSTFWAIDALGQRNLVELTISEVWRIIPLPFVGASSALLVFLWHATCSGTTVRFSWNANRLRVPCFLFILFYFLFTVVAGMNRIFAPRTVTTTYAASAFFAIFTLTLTSFFLITATRIMVRLGKSVTEAEITGATGESRSTTAAFSEADPEEGVPPTTVSPQEKQKKRPESEEPPEFISEFPKRSSDQSESKLTSPTPEGSTESHKNKKNQQQEKNWDDLTRNTEQAQRLRSIFIISAKLFTMALALVGAVFCSLAMFDPRFQSKIPGWTWCLWHSLHSCLILKCLVCIFIFPNP